MSRILTTFAMQTFITLMHRSCAICGRLLLTNQKNIDKRMNRLKNLSLAAVLALAAMEAEAKSGIDYVDPFIGTTNFSICNPGAICPHGLMSVVPFNVMGSDLNSEDKDKRWWSARMNITTSISRASHT